VPELTKTAMGAVYRVDTLADRAVLLAERIARTDDVWLRDDLCKDLTYTLNHLRAATTTALTDLKGSNP
jgi:hypothetical protein